VGFFGCATIEIVPPEGYKAVVEDCDKGECVDEAGIPPADEELMAKAAGVGAAQKHYGRSCVDGSCASGYDLDDVTGMSNGDTAVVPADPTYGGPLYYIYDDPSSLGDDPPDVIAPGSGTGEWILQNLPIQGGGTGGATASAARTNLGVAIGIQVQAFDDELADLAGLSPQKGGMIYWDTASTMARLSANASDVEGYILQACGAYPNTIPCWVNTLDITKLIFPNADDPTTDTEAQCSWDKNNRMLECYDDTSQVLATMEKCEDVTLATPDELQGEDDWWPLKKFPAESYPFGVVIKAIHISTSATCTDALNFEECSDETCGTVSTVEAITLSGTQTEDDGTLSDPNIAADAFFGVDLVDAQGGCNIAWMHITYCYEIEDGN